MDIGPGGDPLLYSSVRVDLPNPYSHVGSMPPQLSGDATNLYWFADNVLDYVYSSHVLEDFEDTSSVLKEWLRVLRVGGRLVIFCPDEQIYREHCRKVAQPLNPHHVHEQFSLKFVKDILLSIGGTRILHEDALVDVYCWEIVIEKQ